MTPETTLEKIIRIIFERKIFCFFGWHRWESSMEDYIEEFGKLTLRDNRICSKAECGVCGKKYLKKEKSSEQKEQKTK